jgi:hypothetical protein
MSRDSSVEPIFYPMGTGVLSLAVKRRGREADHTAPSSAEAKIDGAIHPLPHTFSWCGD